MAEPIINSYLRKMLEQKGSDLHLSVGCPAKFRISGRIVPADDRIIDAPFMEKMLKEICVPEWRWEQFITTHDLDFAHEIPGVARFRCNYF